MQGNRLKFPEVKIVKFSHLILFYCRFVYYSCKPYEYFKVYGHAVYIRSNHICRFWAQTDKADK